MTSLIQSLSLKPQTRKVLAHLLEFGTISNLEALMVHSIPRLAAAIWDLRNVGYGISTELKEDASGHRYSRYRLEYQPAMRH